MNETTINMLEKKSDKKEEEKGNYTPVAGVIVENLDKKNYTPVKGVLAEFEKKVDDNE